jgi:sortase A
MNTAKQSAICYPAAIGRRSKVPKNWWVVWRWIERILFTSGLSLLALYGAVRLEGCLGSGAAMTNLEDDESPAQSAAQSVDEVNQSPEANFIGWAESRVRAYKESLSNRFGSPMAVLQIPKIDLAVPLLDRTDDLTLNHAVGHIAGTARPGEPGNIGIAGHRDGFFRGLKDIKTGDEIQLRTAHGTDTYQVGQIQIVTPDNVGVLRWRPIPSLTLVTCYPFYFVGSAPKRFVVTAFLAERKPAGSTTTETRPTTQISNSTKEQQ